MRRPPLGGGRNRGQRQGGAASKCVRGSKSGGAVGACKARRRGAVARVQGRRGVRARNKGDGPARLARPAGATQQRLSGNTRG